MKQPYGTRTLYLTFLKLFVLSVSQLLFLHKASGHHFHFKNISAREGVLSASVYRVYQDRKGYFWYLTDKGIGRFDGKDWKYFSAADGYEDVGAYHIAEAKDGTLWFITTNFKLYCYTGKRFYHLFPDKQVSWMDFDSDKNLFLLTRGGEFFKAFPSLSLSKQDFVSFSGAIGYSMAVLPDGGQLVGNNFGIFLKRKNSPRTILLIPAKTFWDHIIPRIFRRRNGHVILTNNEGIYDFDPSTEKLTLSIPLKNNEVISFYEDSITNDLWIGTFYGAHYFPGGIISVKNRQVYLGNHSIFSIIKAERGNYFFATKDEGVFICNFNVLHVNEQEGLDGNIAFIRHCQGSVFLFTSHGKMYQVKGQKVVPIHTNIPLIGKVGWIQNVMTVSDSALLLCSSTFYVLKGKRMTPVIIPYGYYPSFWFHQKAQELNLRMLDTSPGNDQSYWNQTVIGRFLHQYFAKNDLIMTTGSAIYNANGRLFIQVTKGLADVHYNREKVLSCRVFPIPDFVSDVKITREGRAIVSTLNKGIAIVRGNRLDWLDTRQGLASEYCSKILIGDHQIWVSTNKGISRIDLGRDDQVLRINNFTADNLLLNNEVNDFSLNNDSVYVATVEGISSFHTQTTLAPSTAHVYIEHIQINNNDTLNEGSFDLPHDHNNINVFYKSPGDGSGEPILYKYVTEGLNDDTVFTNATMLRLGSLLPGKYTTRIWSLNLNGSWNHDPAVLFFHIRPPFWQRIWFIAVAIVLLGLGSVYGTYLYFRTRQRKADLNTRLIESELRSLRLHMNPHFVFNSLASLQKFTLAYKPLDANRYIAKFSRLMRWVMDYSDKHHITLQEELDFLNTYLELEQLRFEKKFNIRIEIDPDMIPGDMLIPPLIVQPFIENAVKYGLTGKEHDSLWLTFKRYPDHLFVSVEDNGVGRDKVKQEQTASGKEYTSTGISYTEERLKLLFKKNRILHPVTIIDLYKDDKAAGTRIELMIPYYND